MRLGGMSCDGLVPVDRQGNAAGWSTERCVWAGSRRQFLAVRKR